MKSEEREAKLSQRRDCDRECCSIESAEQREVQFSKQTERDRTRHATQFTAQQQRELQRQREQVKWYVKATEDGI